MSQKQIMMIKSKEQDVNQYIDNYCVQIDKKNSNKSKFGLIQENLTKANECVQKILLYIHMQSKEKQFIFNESFLEPWFEFYELMNKIFKNTSFLNIVSAKPYRNFQKFFYENKNTLKYKECEEFLTIQDILPRKEQYLEFYKYISNVFIKMKDVSVYNEFIQKYAVDLTKTIENRLPKNSAQEYLKVKQQWTLIFEKIFKYKLQVALSNDGKFPSIMQFMQNPEILMQAIEQAEKTENIKDEAMKKQINFLTTLVNEQTNNKEIDDQLKEIKDCLEDIPEVK